MLFLVYRLYNIKNNKSYVGQTTKGLKRRKSVHFSKLKCGNHPSNSLQLDFNTSSAEDFLIEELERFNSQQELDAGEVKWIEHFKSYEPSHGYNKEKGGRIKKVGPIGSIKKGSKLSDAHRLALKKAKAGKSYSHVSLQNVKKVKVVALNVITNKSMTFETMKDCAHHLCVSASAVRCHIIRKTKLIKKTWKVTTQLGGIY